MTKNHVYSLETKMEAIRLREEGVPVKEIQEKLLFLGDTYKQS